MHPDLPSHVTGTSSRNQLTRFVHDNGSQIPKHHRILPNRLKCSDAFLVVPSGDDRVKELSAAGKRDAF